MQRGGLHGLEQKKAKKQLHSMMLPRKRFTWKKIDEDGDGKITLEEWLNAMHEIVKHRGEDEKTIEDTKQELLFAIYKVWGHKLSK